MKKSKFSEATGLREAPAIEDRYDLSLKEATDVNDFTIRHHPKDSIIMAGGTSLESNKASNTMTSEQANELIRVSRQNRVFSYNKFDASRSSVYTTKFS